MTLQDLESQLLALTPAEKEHIIQLLTQSLVSTQPEIAKPLEISSGEAYIANTQIAIWELVNAQDLGCSDTDLLQMYPQLTQSDLDTAWEYLDTHPDEIRLALQAIDE
ncbi:DUF433 domain-containing protein [Chamaesiphon sp. OTE_20_metabat_361]|uniref:DUF433 domain-containing protein n=1 Tax=Chamaesiphon sp. OTE_20_metabat_361 TaxID=2964689 RepID=UPI00286BA9D0|nr:DUF433 domain-containing protein [Chamaesiphon sp. OTE_20_metabat_361]